MNLNKDYNLITRKLLENKRIYAAYILLVLAPFICALFSMIIHGIGLDFAGFLPVKNDEYMNWYPTLFDYSTYGHLLGVPGYDGMQSAWGNGGVYPFLLYIPYIIFATVFGLSFRTMMFANIFWLCFSLLVLIVLTKPDLKTTILLSVSYMCSFFTISSSLTSMSEPVRLGLFIILTGIVIRWMKKDSINVVEIVLVMAFLFLCAIAYNPTLLVLPVLIMLCCKKIKPIPRLVLSIIMLLIVGIIVLYIMSNILTPYFESSISGKLDAFKYDGIYAGICKVIKDFFSVLCIIDIVSIFNNVHSGIYLLFFIMYLLLVVFLVITIGKQIMMKKCYGFSFYLRLISLYYLLGILLMEGVLHFPLDDTMERVINNALVVSTFMLCYLTPEKKELYLKEKYHTEERENYYRWYVPIEIIVIIFVFFMGIPTIFNARDEQFKAYNVGKDKVKFVEELRAKYSDFMPINLDTNNAWENTVTFYGGDDYLWNAIPGGLSRQLMLYNNSVNENAKYVVYRHYGSPEDMEHVDELIKMGNTIIYSDEYFYIMVNNKYI